MSLAEETKEMSSLSFFEARFMFLNIPPPEFKVNILPRWQGPVFPVSLQL